jgi:AcrR family transcriptional regulator
MVRKILIFVPAMKITPAKILSGKDEKIQIIIEASQKRFGLYGLEKTSMREIADDLKISKASLYYYFPDKDSLYKAVVEKEQDEFISNISARISKIHEPEQLLLDYADVRLSYFRTLLNLSRTRMEAYSALKPGFVEAIHIFTEKEKEIIIEIFNKGISNGVFYIDDKETLAILFLDLLKGLRLLLIKSKTTLFIEPEEYKKLHEKTMEFTRIFIRGLKNKR